MAAGGGQSPGQDDEPLRNPDFDEHVTSQEGSAGDELQPGWNGQDEPVEDADRGGEIRTRAPGTGGGAGAESAEQRAALLHRGRRRTTAIYDIDNG